MKIWTVAVLGVCLAASGAQAQDDDQVAAPEPGARTAEISELEFYVGHWIASGESRPTPTSEFSPLEGEETCEWFSSGTSVVCRETMTDAAGTVDSIYILAYDPSRRHYTVYGTDGNGAIYSGIGSLRDGTWEWDAEMRMGESVFPLKYSFQSDDSGGRDMAVQADAGDGRWADVMKVHYAAAE